MMFTNFKDEQLNTLANLGNVAQFVSFSPAGDQRYSRVIGCDPNTKYATQLAALTALLAASPDKKINIRTFRPDSLQGNDFVYGLSSREEAVSLARKYACDGFYVIANETVDVNDGGVSGVSLGGLFEFAPGATPRVVESGAVASLDVEKARTILERVYRLEPELPCEKDLRVEFSLHPQRRGFRSTHTILWEVETSQVGTLNARPQWPNLFSELVGDKVFGLLIADAYGFPVPKTTAICRKLPPFVFGEATGEDTVWMRTAPKRAEPGFYPTVRGWADPFSLMKEEAEHECLASLLIQDEVRSTFSGALISTPSGDALIEGVNGFGDDFMLGRSGAVRLPHELSLSLQALHSDLQEKLGSVRVEWAYDGSRIWILQLQQTTALSSGKTIVEGDADSEITFDTKLGLAPLREILQKLPKRTRVRLEGNVGMTSHFADVLRRARIPSLIVS